MRDVARAGAALLTAAAVVVMGGGIASASFDGTAQASITVGSATLQPPTDVTLTYACKGKSGGVKAASLTWTPTSSAFAGGYDVLRDGVPYATVASPSATSWTDPSPAKKSHTYTVRSTFQLWTSVLTPDAVAAC